jgi:hypothetical protein
MAGIKKRAVRARNLTEAVVVGCSGACDGGKVYQDPSDEGCASSERVLFAA